MGILKKELKNSCVKLICSVSPPWINKDTHYNVLDNYVSYT